MSILNWFRGKPISQPRKQPTFSPPLPEARGNEPDKPFEQMAVQDVVAWISKLSDNAPFKLISACMLRLYDIAFFDHEVEAADRSLSIKLISSLKESICKQFESDAERLAAFQKATEFTEGRIAYTGVNSLPWLIEEHHVSNADTIPFILRPEHSVRLARFLEMMEAKVLQGAKPHMVRELVLQRHGRAYPNTVLHLHGIACRGDPAAHAIFTGDEFSALIRAPHDYQAARRVLVELGLLSINSSALSVANPPEDNLLKFIVSQTAIDTLAEPPPKPIQKIPPPDEMNGLDVIVPIALCLYLGLSMIESLYGPEKRLVTMDGIERQFGNAADLGLIKVVGLMSNLENMNRTRESDETKKFSLDQMMIFAAWQEFGLWPDTEEKWNSCQPYFEYILLKTTHIRTDYLIRVRSYLRFFIHGQSPVGLPPSAAVSEIRQKISDIYVQYGSRAGVAEMVSLGEDWIGLTP